MLPRLSIALGLACLALLCVAVPAACSSSQKRDQYYGTDEGADYRPEAGVFAEADGGELDAEAGDDATGDRPSADIPVLADAPYEPDTPLMDDAKPDFDADMVP